MEIVSNLEQYIIQKVKIVREYPCYFYSLIIKYNYYIIVGEKYAYNRK